MARIRYLKPEFFTDEDLAELPYQTRLTYAGLWCHADKAGRLEYRPKYLKAMIFPYDNLDIEKQLDLLSQCKHENGLPFIQRYEIDSIKYIQILKWEKHQRPHHTEAESKIPPAPPFIKDKGNGNGKAERPLSELKNGEVTVKKPLKNISIEDNSSFWQEVRKIYTWLDIDETIAKMKGYQLTPKGKNWKMTKRSVIAWLNKQDKPLSLPKEKEKSEPAKIQCKWCKEIYPANEDHKCKDS
jgi:hypothetical protein